MRDGERSQGRERVERERVRKTRQDKQGNR